MNRRGFLSRAGTGALGLAVQSALAPQAEAASPASEKLPARAPLKARLGHQVGQVNDSLLAYLARYGVEGICASADHSRSGAHLTRRAKR